MKAPKKSTSPDQTAEALALRAAGFTALAISGRLGVSVRTLHRIFATHNAKKGAIKEELVAAAREELMSVVTSSAAIRDAAARLIHDDLAHAAHLRTLLLEAAEHLKAENLRDAALVMRAGAAFSTALKNTSDMTRHILRLDDIDDGTDDLPELRIVGLTSEEIASLRGEQHHHRGATEQQGDGVTMVETSDGGAPGHGQDHEMAG